MLPPADWGYESCRTTFYGCQMSGEHECTDLARSDDQPRNTLLLSDGTLLSGRSLRSGAISVESCSQREISVIYPEKTAARLQEEAEVIRLLPPPGHTAIGGIGAPNGGEKRRALRTP